MKAGQLLVDRSPAQRPDAIFAANDLLAIGLLQNLFMQGHIAVPDEIALVGYDDISFASASAVPLTSVRQPTRQIGETAVKILLEEADNPELERRQVLYQPEMVVRASSAPRATA
jgi:LacI family transcriptional regulator